MSDTDFVDLFTARQADVVFAFHGYQRAIHEIVHGRANADRFHVRGFNEQGTTTTPFDMVVLNGMSRYHLAAEALRRSRRVLNRAPALIQQCETEIARAVDYSRRYLEDPPEIRDWVWTVGDTAGGAEQFSRQHTRYPFAARLARNGIPSRMIGICRRWKVRKG